MVRSASRASTPASGVLRQEIDLSPLNPPPAPIDPREAEEPLSFWEQICDVAEDQWATEDEKGFKVYLYEGPGGNGAPYIKRLTHPFDIEWVKENFGGGFYRATLNNPGGKIVASVRFAIEGESKRKPPQNAQAAGVPQHPAGDPFTQVLEIMRDGQRRQEQLLQQLIDSRGANPAPAAAPPAIDPNVALKGVVEIFSGLVARAATPQPQMDFVQMFALVEKLRGPDLLTTLKLAKEAGIIAAAGGGPTDLVTQFKQLKEAAEVVGLGEGKGKGWGETLIEKGPEIIEAGSRIVDKLHQVEQTRHETARTVLAIQQQRGAVITPPPAAPAGQVPEHAGAQPYVHAGPQPNAQVHGAGLEVEAPGSPAAADAIAEAERQDAFIKGKIVEMIAANDSGGEIIDFLDKIDKTICDRFSGASVDQIVYFFSNDPVLKKAAALPRFKPVITEMVEELNAPDEVVEPVRPN